jgi:hypothetical protein
MKESLRLAIKKYQSKPEVKAKMLQSVNRYNHDPKNQEKLQKYRKEYREKNWEIIKETNRRNYSKSYQKQWRKLNSNKLKIQKMDKKMKELEVSLILYHFVKKLVREWNLSEEQEVHLHDMAVQQINKYNEIEKSN